MDGETYLVCNLHKRNIKTFCLKSGNVSFKICLLIYTSTRNMVIVVIFHVTENYQQITVEPGQGKCKHEGEKK